jgi:hypothetical protein
MMTSTVQLQHIVCPGRIIVLPLSPVGNLLSDLPVNGMSACMGKNWQHIDLTSQTIDPNLGIATFSMAAALLSIRIYKICTLPSTGNVDNVVARWRCDARKPLSGAVFRGLAYSPS